MHLAFPAGLWALLALPVIVLIHFLQQRARRVRVSTLFLLEHARPVSVAGARVERLRNSLPLWLQLLAAVIIAWLLSEPRWTRQDSRQQVAVVLDSSVSMSAFQNDALEPGMLRALRPWNDAAAVTEWLLLESDTRKPPLYRGTEWNRLFDALTDFKPTGGSHDPSDALVLARSLVRQNGTVLFVTDRRALVGTEVGVIGVGEPFANVGFAGMEVRASSESGGEASWKALVRNHGREPQTREWWIEWPQASETDRTGPRQRLDLAPGETLTLSGALPPGIDTAVLRLSEDRFSVDDQLPLRRPVARVMRVAIRLEGEAERELFSRMLTALEAVERVESAADADLTVGEIGELAERHAIQISVSGGAGRLATLDPAPVLAENHPLTRDLDFASLLTPAPAALTLLPQDQALLWKGSRPLALLRPDQSDDGTPTQRLLLGWNPAQSSAARNPAMLLLLHRFLDDLRDRKRAFQAGNFETGQPLRVLTGTTDAWTLHQQGATRPFRQRAPEQAGFFEVRDGEETLLAGAAHFGDSREADFREAESFDETDSLHREASRRQSEADPNTPLWLLALAGCLLGSWWRI